MGGWVPRNLGAGAAKPLTQVARTPQNLACKPASSPARHTSLSPSTCHTELRVQWRNKDNATTTTTTNNNKWGEGGEKH